MADSCVVGDGRGSELKQTADVPRYSEIVEKGIARCNTPKVGIDGTALGTVENRTK